MFKGFEKVAGKMNKVVKFMKSHKGQLLGAAAGGWGARGIAQKLVSKKEEKKDKK